MTEELTQQQLEELEQALLKLKVSLEQLLQDTEAGTEPVKLKDNQGRLSRMDELHNQSILLANRNLTKNRLKAVLVAEKRLADDAYGFCEDCGDYIAFSRLLAYPDALRCIECQADADAAGR